MPELTPQDIHESYCQAYRETYALHDGESLPIVHLTSWKSICESLDQRSFQSYTRMAELLNQKIALPTAFVATAKLGTFNQFTVILATSTSGESDAIEQALDAIYESGLEDEMKDDLRNTLTVRKEN